MDPWKLDMSRLLLEMFPDPIHGRSQLARAIGGDPSQVKRWWDGEVAPGPANRAKLAALAKLVTL